MSPAQPKSNPKIDQFLAEINKIQDHYQYTLTPSLQYTPNGIFPVLNIVDRPPKPLNPTEPTAPVSPTTEPTQDTTAPVQAPAAEAEQEPNIEAN